MTVYCNPCDAAVELGHVCPDMVGLHERVEAVQRIINEWAGPFRTGEGMTDDECVRRIRAALSPSTGTPEADNEHPGPADSSTAEATSIAPGPSTFGPAGPGVDRR